MERSANGFWLSTAEFTIREDTVRAPDGSYAIGPTESLTRQQHREFTAEEWQSIANHIATIVFWDSSLHDTERDNLGLDGAEWIVEGIRGGNYRVLERWTPRGPVRGLGVAMLAIAGVLREQPGDVY
jgi:hypothetical protein